MKNAREKKANNKKIVEEKDLREERNEKRENRDSAPKITYKE